MEIVLPCVSCSHPTRPQRTTVQQVPQTRRRQARGLCSRCYASIEIRLQYAPVERWDHDDLMGEVRMLIGSRSVEEIPAAVGVSAAGIAKAAQRAQDGVVARMFWRLEDHERRVVLASKDS